MKLSLSYLFAIVLLFWLIGCASDPIRQKNVGHLKPGATAHLNIGMPKSEVLRLFGPPISANADGNSEVLIYVEERPWWNWVKIAVTVTNGSVARYGDTKYVPETKQTIDLNVREEKK